MAQQALQLGVLPRPKGKEEGFSADFETKCQPRDTSISDLGWVITSVIRLFRGIVSFSRRVIVVDCWAWRMMGSPALGLGFLCQAGCCFRKTEASKQKGGVGPLYAILGLAGEPPEILSPLQSLVLILKLLLLLLLLHYFSLQTNYYYHYYYYYSSCYYYYHYYYYYC